MNVNPWRTSGLQLKSDLAWNYHTRRYWAMCAMALSEVGDRRCGLLLEITSQEKALPDLFGSTASTDIMLHLQCTLHASASCHSRSWWSCMKSADKNAQITRIAFYTLYIICCDCSFAVDALPLSVGIHMSVQALLGMSTSASSDVVARKIFRYTQTTKLNERGREDG
jgi:hypothetical protein